MYKGLREELTDVVDKIKVGDGIVFKYNSNPVIKTELIGFVRKKTSKKLRLGYFRKPKTSFERFTNLFKGYEVQYKEIADIRIVD